MSPTTGARSLAPQQQVSIRLIRTLATPDVSNTWDKKQQRGGHCCCWGCKVSACFTATAQSDLGMVLEANPELFKFALL